MSGKTTQRSRLRIRPQVRRHARTLRRALTPAEQRLWSILRQRQLLGYKFRRQHPCGPYILDFVCLEAGLVIEVDGGQHQDRRSHDRVRSDWLEVRGFRVMRFWINQVLGDLQAVAAVILRALSFPDT